MKPSTINQLIIDQHTRSRSAAECKKRARQSTTHEQTGNLIRRPPPCLRSRYRKHGNNNNFICRGVHDVGGTTYIQQRQSTLLAHPCRRMQTRDHTRRLWTFTFRTAALLPWLSPKKNKVHRDDGSVCLSVSLLSHRLLNLK